MNLSGKNKIDFEKTSEMLDEDKFWAIVDSCYLHSFNDDEQERYLIKEIEKLTPKEMVGFRLRTDKLLYDSYFSEMWCAGHLMNRGYCSDDGFEYFRCWVISRGRDTYYKAKANPDYLVIEVIKGKDFYDFESFWYVAIEAFKNKTGKDLAEYIDEDNFKTREFNYPPIKSKWNEDKPETMKKICPKLFEKFWK